MILAPVYTQATVKGYNPEGKLQDYVSDREYYEDVDPEEKEEEDMKMKKYLLVNATVANDYWARIQVGKKLVQTLEEAMKQLEGIINTLDDYKIIEIDVENEKIKTHSIELVGGEIRLKEKS